MKFRYALSFHLTPRKKYIKLSCNTYIYIHILSPYVTSQSIKIVWKSTAQLLFGSHPHGWCSECVPLPICRGLGRGVGSQQPREQKSLREASLLLNQLGRLCRILLDSVPDFPSGKGAGEFLPEESFFDPSCFSSIFIVCSSADPEVYGIWLLWRSWIEARSQGSLSLDAPQPQSDLRWSWGSFNKMRSDG